MLMLCYEVPIGEIRADVVTDLDLRNRKIGQPEAFLLAQLIELNACSALEVFDVSENDLGAAAKAISDAMAMNAARRT